MYTHTLLFLSYALSSVASPLSTQTSRVAARNIEQRAAKETSGTALGTFGPHGLLGEINPDGSAVVQPAGGDNAGDDAGSAYTPPVFCVKGCGAAVVVEMAIIGTAALIQLFKHWTSFHNDPPDWPTYEDGSYLWSVRTFRNTECGETGHLGTGQNPNGKDKDGPYMMSEYRSQNMNYHDNQPCENFMFQDPKDIGNTKVESAAVWLSSSVQNAYITLYSNPVCNATVNDGKTASQWEAGWQDIAAVYDGTGLQYNPSSDSTPPTTPGTWVCLAGTWNAFSVVQIGQTDMTVKKPFYVNGEIPPPATQPKNRAAGQGANNYKYSNWLTTDITKVGPAPLNPVSWPVTGPE